MSNVRLKRYYSVVAHSHDIVELRYGAWNSTSFTLTDETGSGRLLGIIDRLDGLHSVDEIASAEGVPRSQVDSLLEQLADLKLLEDRSTHALDYYLDQLAPNLALQEDRPKASPLPVILFGDTWLSELIAGIMSASAHNGQYNIHAADAGLRTLLLRCGTSWSSDSLAFEDGIRPFADWAGRLTVFAMSNVNPIEMQAFNRISLRYGIPWIHAAIDGPCLLVGPTFVPFRTPCYECFETRVFMNMKDGASYQRYKRAIADGRSSGSGAPLDAVLGSVLASLTALEAVNFLLTGSAFTVAKVLSVYLPTMEFTFNEGLRLPGCRACSPAPECDDQELYFDLRALMNDERQAQRIRKAK